MHRQVVDTDVLIIGGGAAGTRAALECSGLGLRTTMLVKGLLGKSGCSIFAGNLNLFAPPKEQKGQSVERILMFLAKYTHFLGDQEYMKNASSYNAAEFYPWLERNGAYVLRDSDGEIVSDIPHRMQGWVIKMGMSGQVVLDIMRKMVLTSDVNLLEQTTVTRLLVSDGRAVGAVAFDYIRGNLLIVRAKVVILATGHSNYLSIRSTGTRDGAANGWVMAHEAGAKLQNIEMQWHHVSDAAYPATWMRLHWYPNPLPRTAHRSRLYNSEGELFFDGNWFEDNPVPYILQLKHLVKEIEKGKASLEGGYYSSYRHVEPEVLKNDIYQVQFAEKVGVDLTKEDFESGVTWHMNVGGVRVDGATMKTDVPGLLAIGSVSALVTGGLANCLYDGLVASRTAAEEAAGAGTPKVDDEQVRAEEQRVVRLMRTEPEDGLLPGQVKKRIRKAMWQHMNYVKTAESMNAARAELRRIEEEDLPRMRLKSDEQSFNYDLVDALDAVDMLAALQLQVEFSLYRKESRGAFYRKDYPVTDNRDWLKHVIGYKKNGSIEIEAIPVPLPYAKPEEGVLDYFEVDY